MFNVNDSIVLTMNGGQTLWWKMFYDLPDSSLSVGNFFVDSAYVSQLHLVYTPDLDFVSVIDSGGIMYTYNFTDLVSQGGQNSTQLNYCDNYVSNGGFGILKMAIGGTGQIGRALSWSPIKAVYPQYTHPNAGYHSSTDIFSAQSTSSYLQVPTNYVTHLYSQNSDDDEYAGIVTYLKEKEANRQRDDYREFLVQKLPYAMQSGKTYVVRFYAAAAKIGKKATSVQCLFAGTSNFPKVYQYPQTNSNPLLTFTYSQNANTFVQCQPQITSPIITDSLWTAVDAIITVPVGEIYEYLIIGNFKDNANTDISGNPSYVSTHSQYTDSYFETMKGYLLKETGYVLIDNVQIYEKLVCSADLELGFCNTDTYFSDYAAQIMGINSISVEGNLIIDSNCILNGKHIRFGPFAKLTILPGVDVTIRNSYLRGCNNMWEGVDAHPNSMIRLENTRVEDAYIGLLLNNPNSFSIENSRFNINEVGIEIRNLSNNNGSKIIYGTLFEKTENLKDSNIPYANLKGILVRNCNSEPILGSGIYNANRFQNIRHGIELSSANALIKNNHFSNLETGIYAYNDISNPKYTLKAGDLFNLAEKNIVLDCKNGFKVSGRWRTEIFNNEIGRTDKAIWLLNGATSSGPITEHLVFGNRIQLSSIGIFLENLGNSGNYQIVQNLLSNITSPKLGSLGISVSNKMQPLKRCTHFSYFISNNKIYRFDTGIDLSGGSCAEIADNQINTYVQPTEYVQRHGIVSRNAISNFIYRNAIKGSSVDWRNIGIRTEQLYLSDCFCNTVNKANVGLWGGLINYQNRYYVNSLTEVHRGFLVNYGAVGKQYFNRILPQISYDPENTIVSASLNGIPGWQGYANHGAYSAHSTYFNIAFDHYAIGYPWVSTFPNTPGNRPTCIPEYRPKIDSVFGEGSSYLGQVIEEHTEINGMYGQNRNIYNEINRYHYYLENKTALDSLAETQVYLSNVQGNYSAAIPLAQIYAEAGNNNWDEAAILAQNLQVDSELEEMYVDYLLIYKKGLFIGYDSLNQEEISRIQYIANSCLYEYGTVVNWARELLFQHLGEYTEIHDCEKTEQYGVNQIDSDQVEELPINHFSISPNPANQSIVLSNTYADNCQYQIWNNGGVMLTDGVTHLGSTSIDLTALLSGIYQVRVLEEGIFLGSLTLIKQ